MAHSSFETFLSRSLSVLEREMPRVFEKLCATLAHKELELCIDGTPVALRFTPALRIGRGAEAPHIRVTSDRATILDVLEGLSLEDAIEGDRIVLIGAPDDLVLFHDALLIYLHGAVRAPSFPALLDEYRWGEPRAGVSANTAWPTRYRRRPTNEVRPGAIPTE